MPEQALHFHGRPCIDFLQRCNIACFLVCSVLITVFENQSQDHRVGGYEDLNCQGLSGSADYGEHVACLKTAAPACAIILMLILIEGYRGPCPRLFGTEDLGFHPRYTYYKETALIIYLLALGRVQQHIIPVCLDVDHEKIKDSGA